MTQHRTLLLCSTLLLACGGADARSGLDVERVDSAGIEVVSTRGADVALEWQLEPALRIGEEEGPAAFGAIFADGVATRDDGGIAVLDAMSQRVLLFDGVGTHLATLGRKGGGPGEMQFPNAIAVDEEGAVSVYDFSKRGVLRFGADGSVLPQVTLPPLDGTRLRATRDHIWGVYTDRSGFGEPSTLSLLGVPLEGTDTVRLASWTEPAVKAVQFPNCAVGITMGPLLAPRLQWGGSANRIAFGVSDGYSISVWQDGKVQRIVRRDTPPEPVTQELAEREVGDSMRIRFGGGACAIPPRDVVTARGFADVVPVFRDVTIDPYGRLWVARGVGPRTEWRIDVFAADGAYIGTLPAGSPVPAAFTRQGELIAVDRDELDRQFVVVYRIGEGDGR